jgi:hypothetical protein
MEVLHIDVKLSVGVGFDTKENGWRGAVRVTYPDETEKTMLSESVFASEELARVDARRTADLIKSEIHAICLMESVDAMESTSVH